MQNSLDLLKQCSAWEEIEEARRQKKRLLISGLSGSAKSFLTAALQSEHEDSILYLAPSASAAEQIFYDLAALLPQREIYLFPARENPLHGIIASSPELLAERQQVLHALSTEQGPLVVTSVGALYYRLPAPTVFKGQGLHLQQGQEISLETLSRSLVSGGYEHVALVEHPGQFSRRGGIIDIYSPGHDWPVRLEFFGDEIDIIKQFDLTSQRSLANVSRVLILPAVESVWHEGELTGGLERIGAALARAKEASPALVGQLEDNVGADYERLQAGLFFAGRERYLNYFQERAWNLFDYLSPRALVIVDEPGKIMEQAETDYKFFLDSFTDLLAAGKVLREQEEIFLAPNLLLERLPADNTLFLALFPRRPAFWQIEGHTSFIINGVQNFYGQSEFLQQELGRWLANDYRILIMGGNKEQQKQIATYLKDEGFQPKPLAPADGLEAGEIGLVDGNLAQGFDLPQIRFCLLTTANLIGRLRTNRRARLTKAEGARLANYRDLAVGDFVVHVQHGIGKYLGLESLQIDGVERDYLKVQYAGEDRLYVPTDQIELLQKYVGAEGRKPRIYGLGGGDWQKVKNRVRQSVQEMARQLLDLYAARQEGQGFAFPADSEWQEEMEARFLYRETEDQLKAIAAIKGDLEEPKPMDRLLCGDVGYGKTEVALRAAFKVASAGKQVALLVPTTILAQQHYMTFSERFRGFPLEVGLLSRFSSPEESKETVRRLRQGLVDVVIGTHRLLQKDIKFWDLGLLIIDEEQRFGVGHKEQMKMLKANVDTLVLTATPIPRTLHMAMVGMRDMSLIETPPADRFPVQTHVAEYNDELIRQAIRRELERGGQVYYVHNRVRSIRYVVERLSKLVPEANIAYGHGRMGEKRLERLMLDFIEGQYDVLVSTTIIESGLDIPNVNTLIVEDADRFGLAQLYQLRGRVGRSNRVAFAYFTYRKDKALTEVAEKRLQAIKEFSELGAGFKIAMRDLEIRGAGNILGPEQHGFMVAVGFDLYCQLLEEAVGELKGEAAPPREEADISIALDAYIPDRYIHDSKQKIEMYKKIRAALTREDVDDIEDEMLDRYGDLPEAVSNLLLVARLRVEALGIGLSHLSVKPGVLRMQLAPGAALEPRQVEWLYEKTGGQLRLQPRRPGVFLWQVPKEARALAKQWVNLMQEM